MCVHRWLFSNYSVCLIICVDLIHIYTNHIWNDRDLSSCPSGQSDLESCCVLLYSGQGFNKLVLETCGNAVTAGSDHDVFCSAAWDLDVLCVWQEFVLSVTKRVWGRMVVVCLGGCYEDRGGHSWDM